MDEEKGYSSRTAFAKAVIWGHARLGVIALVSAVFFADDFSEQFIKPRVSPEAWSGGWERLTVIGSLPSYLWVIVVLLILLLGTIESAFRLYRAARKRGDEAIAQFENYTTKQLELTWNSAQEPYRWQDESQNPHTLYFRLRVKNICGVTVDDIKAERVQLNPRTLACVPCPLRLMNNILPSDDPPVHQFSLNPGDEKFIEVMLQSRSLAKFWILHTLVPRINVEVPKQAYDFTIRVSARNVPEILRRFEVVEDGEDWAMREAHG